MGARLPLVLVGIAGILVPARSAEEPVPGRPIRVLTSDFWNYRFGEAMSAAGDIDGDGYGDLAIGVPADPPQMGEVRIFSGRDATLLRTLRGHGWWDGFGWGIANVGDADGRGVPDLLVASIGGGNWDTVAGYAMVFAGEDGTVHFDSGVRDPDIEYGRTLGALGDLDGDGTGDFGVGFIGGMEIVSGADGALLHAFGGWDGYRFHRDTVARLDDVNDDGVPDFAVGTPHTITDGSWGVGRVTVFSGATFEALNSFDGAGEGNYFGADIATLAEPGEASRYLVVGGHPRAPGIAILDARSGRVVRRLRIRGLEGLGGALTCLGDQDGDGTPDIATLGTGLPDESDGNHEWDSGGLVAVVSGADGSVLFARRGWPGEGLWNCIADAGDADGDGRSDLAILASPVLEGEGPEVRVYRAESAPGRSRVRVALQPGPGVEWSWGVAYFLEIGFSDALPPLSIAYRGEFFSPADFWFGQFLLESAPGSGSLLPIGASLDGSDWSPTVEFRRLGLMDLAGRRFRLAWPPDGDYVEAVIPAPDAEDFRGRTALAPPGLESGTRGTVRVSTFVGRGVTRVDLRCRGLLAGPAYSVWVEGTIGEGDFAEAGTLARGRLLLDTGRANPLPGWAADGPALSGRAIEVRDGETIVLRGTLP